MKKIITPYESYNQLSKEFTDEVWFRTQSAIRAIKIFSHYQKRKVQDEYDPDEFKSIRYILVRFAVLEIATILDGNSKFALKLSKNKRGTYVLQRDSLNKFLNSLNKDDFSKVYYRLESLFRKNQSLVKKILDTRNNKIAHASISSYNKTRNHLILEKFPKKAFYKFSNELGGIFMQTAFGFFSGLQKDSGGNFFSIK